jgi:thiamine-phosphate pyrophosphorylase
LTEGHPSQGRRVLPADPFLYPIIDASMVGEHSLSDWVKWVAGPGKAPLVQWRFKGLTDAAALAGAEELRAATRDLGVMLIINDRPDIARMVEADGVHLGQEDLDPEDARALLPGVLIGVSTHNRSQFETALTKPVDYIAVGPVFATASKANPDPVVGLPFVTWAREQTSKPIVAIGGITGANVFAVTRAGARGLAVISELMKAARPEEAAAAFAETIRPARAG